MRISKVLVGSLLLLCVACNKSEKETPSGLKFKVIKAGDGILPKPQEVVVFNYLFTDSKDSVWGDTYKQDFPPALMIADTAAIKQEDGMMQMLRMVSKGDSVQIHIALTDFFRDVVKSPVPPGFDTTLMLDYKIKIEDIMPREQYIAKQTELREQKAVAQREKDVAQIDAYLTEKNIAAEKHESGLRYVVTKPGKGENAKSGQTVKVTYSGYMLDGQYFDSNDKKLAQEKGLYNAGREPYEPYEVIIDQTQVIKGWHEALKLMNKGSKATFYIPSELGYGPRQRNEIIKENSILVFDLEMVDLK